MLLVKLEGQREHCLLISSPAPPWLRLKMQYPAETKHFLKTQQYIYRQQGSQLHLSYSVKQNFLQQVPVQTAVHGLKVAECKLTVTNFLQKKEMLFQCNSHKNSLASSHAAHQLLEKE